MITIFEWHVSGNILVATLKVKVTAWPCSKTCLVHNFVFEVPFLKLVHINDHHINKTCGKQHLGRYLEGQGHTMTLQQNVSGP